MHLCSREENLRTVGLVNFESKREFRGFENGGFGFDMGAATKSARTLPFKSFGLGYDLSMAA